MASTLAALTPIKRPANLKIKTVDDLCQWVTASESPFSGLIKVLAKTSDWQKAWDEAESVVKALALEKHSDLVNKDLLL